MSERSLLVGVNLQIEPSKMGTKQTPSLLAVNAPVQTAPEKLMNEYREAFAAARNGSQTVPGSIEAVVGQLLYHFRVVAEWPHSSPLMAETEVCQCFDQLAELLHAQQQAQPQLKETLKLLDSISREKPAKNTADALYRMLRNLQPLDVAHLLKLLEQTSISAEVIRGQDIILLLGATGSGKSTTIHYLSGSEMELLFLDKGATELTIEESPFQ